MSNPRVKGNGQGSVFRRADRPNWVYAQVSFEGKRKTSRHKNVSAANAWIRQELSKRDRGELIMGKSPTVGAFLTAWLRETARPRLRASALRGYEQNIRLYLLPAFGSIRLDKLSPAAIQTFQNQMMESGKAPATARYARAVLRVALRQAVRWGLLTRNPVDLVDGPRVEREEIKPFTREEAAQLLAAARGDRLEALYSVALSLGLRQGEALGLQWDDVDLEANILHVHRQLLRTNGKLVLAPVKTKKSRRDIRMPASIASALRDHRQRQISDGIAPTGFVFTATNGSPLDARNVVRSYKALLKRANLSDRRFHDLRHGAASFMFARHIAPKIVQSILGHSQIQITMDLYTHVMPELFDDAAERMDAIFAR